MTNKKKVLGIGINDADYVLSREITISEKGMPRKRKLAWYCPIYYTWNRMLSRCYSSCYLKRNPSYIGCTVCDEWLIFSNFKKWMENQDYEGKQLDKDILFVGNKVYSPSTCVFVYGNVNRLLIDRGRRRGNYPLGVSKSKYGFEAACSNGKNYQEYLGTYNTPAEAHEAWRKYKHTLACKLADEQTDKRVAEALRKRYSEDEWQQNK